MLAWAVLADEGEEVAGGAVLLALVPGLVAVALTEALVLEEAALVEETEGVEVKVTP